MSKTNNLIFIFIVLILFGGCSAVKKSAAPATTVPEAVALPEDPENLKQNEFQYLFVEALKQKMMGNSQNAVSLFSNCLEIDPNSAAAMYELANVHASNNDFTSASLLLEKAISINPGNKWYKMFLAQLYQQMQKFNESARIYSQLLVEEPENVDFNYMKAVMLTSAGKFEEAIKSWDQLEKIVGLNEQISVEKEQLYVSAGKIKEAFAEIRKLIDSNPNETKYFGLLADLYLSQGDKENALKYYNKILEIEPGNGFVHFSLSNYYQEEGDLEKAYQHVKTGFACEDVDVDTKFQIYLMLTSDKSPEALSDEKNEELVGILIKTHSDDSRVFIAYAEYLIRKSRLPEAREQLRNAVKLNNGDYLIWERILYIDNDLQDWETLYSDSEEVVGLFPNQPQVYFLKGVACIQLEKYDETIQICRDGADYVVDNLPLKGQFKMLEGEARYKLGQADEAFKLFDSALELDPENYIAMNNFAYYLSLIGRDLEKAERMSGKVVERFPDNATYLDTYAWVLFKMKNYQLAKFYMDSAIANGGQDNPTLLEHYGDILIMLEKPEEAKEYWQKAKSNGSDSDVLDRKIKDLKYYEN